MFPCSVRLLKTFTHSAAIYNKASYSIFIFGALVICILRLRTVTKKRTPVEYARRMALTGFYRSCACWLAARLFAPPLLLYFARVLFLVNEGTSFRKRNIKTHVFCHSQSILSGYVLFIIRLQEDTKYCIWSLDAACFNVRLWLLWQMPHALTEHGAECFWDRKL